MRIYYRISDNSSNRQQRLFAENKLKYLGNFLKVFSGHLDGLYIVADNTSDCTLAKLKSLGFSVEETRLGNSGSLNHVFRLVIDGDLPDEETVYFVEDDYLHRFGSPLAIEEGLSIDGISYVSLYDHLDKYKNSVGDHHDTKVFVTKSTHWKIAPSTCMTFATTVGALRRNKKIHYAHVPLTPGFPNDHQMFLALGQANQLLVTPLPGFATQANEWASPLMDWKKIGKAINEFA